MVAAKKKAAAGPKRRPVVPGTRRAKPAVKLKPVTRMTKRQKDRAVVELREKMLAQFYERLFLLGNFIGDTDTYKRTMCQAFDSFSLDPAAYHLTFRKGLPAEEGAGDQLVMAGHELLHQWFNRPLSRRNIHLAKHWFSARDKDPTAVGSYTGAFPHKLWDKILRSQRGEDIYLPVDIWGFPGGQTFLKGVPAMSFEGMGGAISYLEPAKCRYFVSVIHATKARLMKQVCSNDAEFGLRSAPLAMNNILLLLARYVGGRGTWTSNDTAEFLWPELFKTVGSTGHEGMSHTQSFDRPLGESEYETMDLFAERMGCGFLLCDLVDANTVGKMNAIKCIKKYKGKAVLGVRVDSGDIAQQCVDYYHVLQAEGLTEARIVFEDEVSPDTVRKVYQLFREKTGVEPEMLIPGAGGWWWRLVHRDTVSAKFARSMTNGRPNVKFSNSPGKESLGGNIRVYAQDDTLVVADVSETIEGISLYTQLVKRGRIVYNETPDQQADRSDYTWGRYKRFVLSPLIADWMARFNEMRTDEIAAAQALLSDK
ncbi:MAG: hypothetical protein K2W82_17565 [Candidatus Obscuribacterales bacterium]|nr:hypothetical protein [Candidatus Obscuribacterales bacterium]